MRILFVTGEYPPMQGGVGDCTNAIAQALAAADLQVTVLTSAGSGEGATRELGTARVQRAVKHWGWNTLSALRGTIVETQADIVHIQYQTAAFGMHPAINMAPRLLRSPRTRFAVTFHDLRVPYLFPKAGPVREWITFQLARNCDAVIATNEEDYALLDGQYKGTRALIPIGSNISPTPPPGYDRNAWRWRWGTAPNETLLSYFGFLNESKGGETLIRALALVPGMKLLMVGGPIGASDPTNADYLWRVKRLIAELGLETRVFWTDYMPPEEVSGTLLASDICVLPYRDGASFRRGTFMAALAHGLPVVTTVPLGGARTALAVTNAMAPSLPRLRDGQNVCLVPPDQPEALAGAILRLAGDSTLRKRLMQGALELALAFTWDKIAAQHIELYKSLGVK